MSRPGIRAAVIAVVCAWSIAACGSTTGTSESHFRIERSQRGDTTIVRNLGTNSPALAVELVRERVLGRSDAQAAEHFGPVLFVTGRPDGSAFIGDAPPARLQLFDSAGSFVRSYGRDGLGPGEFRAPGRVAMDGKGLLYHSTVPFRVSVFDSAARLVDMWDAPMGVYGWHVDSAGNSYHYIENHRDPSEGSPLPDTPYMLVHTRNGQVIDTIAGPVPFGERRTFPVRYEGEVKRSLLPLSPRFLVGFGAPGAWVYGSSEQYVLFVRGLDGSLTRIESDRTPVRVERGEREELARNAIAIEAASGRSGHVAAGDVPRFKPYFRDIQLAPDGRIWVLLHSAALASTVTKCPPSAATFSLMGEPATGRCEDGRSPRPMEVWTEPRVFDVFEHTGELRGRVALPPGMNWLSSHGDYLWVREPDGTEGRLVSRYRIVWPGARLDSPEPRR